MSCAADEPGTERGHAAAARGSAGALGRGRGARGTSARRGWTAAAGSERRAVPSRSVPGPKPRVPSAEPELTEPPSRVSPSQLGDEGSEAPKLIPLLLPGETDAEKSQRVPRREPTQATRGQGSASTRGKPPQGRDPRKHETPKTALESPEIDPNDNCSGGCAGSHALGCQTRTEDRSETLPKASGELRRMQLHSCPLHFPSPS